jgi:hypothetical protein
MHGGCQEDDRGDSPRDMRPTLSQTDRVKPMSHPEPAPAVARQAAYRRLALTILALDVPTLTTKLQAMPQRPMRLPQALPGPARQAA